MRGIYVQTKPTISTNKILLLFHIKIYEQIKKNIKTFLESLRSENASFGAAHPHTRQLARGTTHSLIRFNFLADLR